MNRSYTPNGLNVVNDAFRNSEWSNFLATKNGNYYYRLQREPGLVSTNVRKDNGGYFMSHTMPWEEFSGLGTPSPIGSKVLYEFPHDTFGDLLASTSKGHYTSNDVAELGKLHLLYGNTSSGKRGLVRVTSDENAKLLDMSPFKYGIVDRPKTSNGFYDNNPIYEDVGLGNQTVVSPQVLNNALQNTSYNMYQYSPQGIVKSIYSPLQQDGSSKFIAFKSGTGTQQPIIIYDRRTGKPFNIDQLDFDNNVYFTHGTSDQGMEGILKEGMTNGPVGVDLTGTVLAGNKEDILQRISQMPNSRYKNIAILQYPKKSWIFWKNNYRICE